MWLSRSAAARRSVSHMAVLSAGAPRDSPRTSAAAEEGARAVTDPAPCSACQASTKADRAVVLPAPAGPTMRSRRLPLVATASIAAS